jgi:Lysyl oxidase
MMPLRRVALLASLFATLAAASPAHAHPNDVLPDLDQIVPTDLVVKGYKIGPHRVWRLGFASAAANVGAGPLTLHGYRRSTKVTTMRADQLIDQTAGGFRLLRDVGRMSYVVHPDHKHWHLLGFEKYELRAPGDDRVSLRADRKTGFCLGDRYAIPGAAALPGFTRVPLQGDTCGLGRPDLKSIFVGISTGWADRYEAHIEGQYIDITDAPSRKYVLVHRVNVDGKIAESNYANNASSVLFSLNWLNGRDEVPRITVLRRCPGTASCPG